MTLCGKGQFPSYLPRLALLVKPKVTARKKFIDYLLEEWICLEGLHKQSKNNILSGVQKQKCAFWEGKKGPVSEHILSLVILYHSSRSWTLSEQIWPNLTKENQWTRIFSERFTAPRNQTRSRIMKWVCHFLGRIFHGQAQGSTFPCPAFSKFGEISSLCQRETGCQN